MKRILLMSSLAVLWLAGCDSAHKEAPASAESVAVAADTAEESPVAKADDDSAEPWQQPQVGANADSTPTTTPRRVIYTGDVAVEVTDYERASRRVDSLIAHHDAYLSAGNESRTLSQHQNEMTIKVPPAEFLPLITALGQLGQLQDKHISSDDVTSQVVDLTARIHAKQAVEAHFLTLLAKARTIRETLEVEEQIKAVREEIEVMQAQRLTLTRQSAMATITLHYFQPIPMQMPEAPTVAFWPRLTEAFYSGWALLLGLLIGLTNLWPFWVFGPLLYLLWTRVLRSRIARG